VRARTALFTLFGEVVRPAGGTAWLSAITGAMGALGFAPPAVRTALHRLAGEGWVTRQRHGRFAAYRLTAAARARLDAAAARIYRTPPPVWDGRWRLLVHPGLADAPELRRAVEWTGFGRLSADTWISPHEPGAELDGLLARGDGQPLARLTTEPAGDREHDRRLAAAAWDLAALREAHAGFLVEWPADAARAAERDPDPELAALALRLRLVHRWRRFLHLDPGLPPEVLPPDWLGDAAAERFAALHARLEAPAWRAWRRLSGETDPAPAPTTPATA
jgi:phenylacetic acid degradation operon negative regulatory protein